MQNLANTPQPQNILIKSPSDPNNPDSPTKPVAKDLFNLVITPNQITVNKTKIKDVAALTQLLQRYNKPMITMSVHRCADADIAKSLLNTAQQLTDTPIAYNAFGNYTDHECFKQ